MSNLQTCQALAAERRATEVNPEEIELDMDCLTAWLKVKRSGQAAGFGFHVSTYQGNPVWCFEPQPTFRMPTTQKRQDDEDDEDGPSEPAAAPAAAMAGNSEDPAQSLGAYCQGMLGLYLFANSWIFH